MLYRGNSVASQLCNTVKQATMRESFPAALKQILKFEGGYSDHPEDDGGATNHGITQATYDGYRRRLGQIPRSVKQLTDDEIAAIYKQLYWDKVCGDQLPVGIDLCVFDAAVNSGPARGAEWLQDAINDVSKSNRLKVDKNIGPATLDASDDYPAASLIVAMVNDRLGFMKVAKNKEGHLLWTVFGKDWSQRLLGTVQANGTRGNDGLEEIALAMAAGATVHGVTVAPAPAAPKVPLPTTAINRPTTVPSKPVAAPQLAPVHHYGLAALLGALLTALAAGVHQWFG